MDEVKMLFGFSKNHKTRTLLFAAGFLVIAGLTSLVIWLYLTFMVSHDDFFDAAPIGTSVFWHESSGEEVDAAWLYDLSQRFLSGGASEQAGFLFENIAPSSRETAFAILSGFEDFIFWGNIDAREFGDLKEKLETQDFNYIFENSGKITIANSKVALKEVLAVLSQKNFSLADEKVKLIAWNRAARRHALQIYFSSGLKLGNLEIPAVKSDFWENNEAGVLKKHEQAGNGLAGYYYIIDLDNHALGQAIPDVIKNSLAVAFPETRDKKLPDDTVVREIVADPDKFSFEKRKISGYNVDYLAVPEVGEDFIFVNEEERVVFGTSVDEMASYLVRLGFKRGYYGKNIIELSREWLKWVTKDFNGLVFGVNVDKL